MEREAIVEETRKWVRSWEAEQREMVLWILEEEVRHDKLRHLGSSWHYLKQDHSQD